VSKCPPRSSQAGRPIDHVLRLVIGSCPYRSKFSIAEPALNGGCVVTTPYLRFGLPRTSPEVFSTAAAPSKGAVVVFLTRAIRVLVGGARHPPERLQKWSR
jgi:hypothetical protein